jgi:hypothetical protein
MLENYKTTEELVKQLLDKIKERINFNKHSCSPPKEQNHEPKL